MIEDEMISKFFCTYHLIVNTSKLDGVKVIINRLNQDKNVFGDPATIQPYHKEPRKMEVFGNIELPEISFDNVMLWLCRHFQFQFTGWRISGDYDNEIMMQAEKFRDSGLCFFNLTISRWG